MGPPPSTAGCRRGTVIGDGTTGAGFEGASSAPGVDSGWSARREKGRAATPPCPEVTCARQTSGRCSPAAATDRRDDARSCSRHSRDLDDVAGGLLSTTRRWRIFEGPGHRGRRRGAETCGWREAGRSRGAQRVRKRLRRARAMPDTAAEPSPALFHAVRNSSVRPLPPSSPRARRTVSALGEERSISRRRPGKKRRSPPARSTSFGVGAGLAIFGPIPRRAELESSKGVRRGVSSAAARAFLTAGYEIFRRRRPRAHACGRTSSDRRPIVVKAGRASRGRQGRSYVAAKNLADEAARPAIEFHAGGARRRGPGGP